MHFDIFLGWIYTAPLSWASRLRCQAVSARLGSVTTRHCTWRNTLTAFAVNFSRPLHKAYNKGGNLSSTKNPGRYAGLLYVLTSIAGFFAMGYVPGKVIVHGNAAVTASNIVAHEMLFRFGIAGELIGQASFIFVALALYDLLKGVNRRQASLMVTLIVVSIPIAFVNELNSIAALVLVRGVDFLSLFEKPQREALAMLFLNLHHHGFVFAELFWGLWLFPLALLVYRSRFLPRFLGVWLALAGFAWVILSLTGILLPQLQDKVDTYSQPAFFGEIAFMLWLLIKGATPRALDATASSSSA
jgi:hypothetical protein